MMKKFKLLSLMLILAMTVTVFCSCGKKTQTFEDYINSHSELQDEIDDIAAQTGCSIDITGNDLIYTYDYTDYGLTQEMAENEELKAQLESALESYASTFTGVVADLEEETELTGIHCIVRYTLGDYVIVEKTFDSTGIVG